MAQNLPSVYRHGYGDISRMVQDFEARLEAAERERRLALNLVRVKAKANARWRRLMSRSLRGAEKRAEAAEAKIAAIRDLHRAKHGEAPRYSIHAMPGVDEPTHFEPYVICDADGTYWPCATILALQESEGE